MAPAPLLSLQVAGNFHVALGESVVRDGRFIHQFQPDEAPGFNTSHVVHSLSFGDPYPGSASKTSGFDPMAGLERINPVEQGTGLYQYFIKLVPTIYDAAGGKRGALPKSPKPVFPKSPKLAFPKSPKPAFPKSPKPAFPKSPKPAFPKSPKPAFSKSPKPAFPIRDR